MNSILVTFALEEEARPFRAAARDLPEVRTLVTGIGRSNTERAIRQALADAQPRLVLTCGYAGALDPALKIGDVVFEADPNCDLGKKLAGLAQPVKVFCSDKVLVTVAQKTQARAESGAQAVDMESEFIRRACRATGIPSATVRAISDLAGEDFPLDFNRLAKPDQSLDPKKLAWAILTSPRSIPGLLRLRRNTRLAADALAATLHCVITRLKSEFRIFYFPLLLALSCASSALSAQDWPYWRGPARDGKVTGFTAPATWPAALAQKWRTPVGLGDATPAMVGDKLYAFGREADEEVVRCLNAGNGRELWRYAYPAVPVTGPAEKYAGPRSSPTVARDKIVTLGVGGVLTCLDAASGKVVWRQEALAKALPRFFTAMSPLVADGLCVVHLGGKDEGLLVALELATGKVKWQWAGEGPAYASPVLLTMSGTTQVVLQTEASLTGLTMADGQRLWQTLTSPKPGYWNSATPVVDGPTVYYSGQGTGTRAVRVEKQGDAFTARELWHNAQYGTVYNTPVLKDGRLFALSDRGQFFCLDAATGQTAWASTNRVSNFGSLVDAGKVLVALPEKSGLIFFKPSRDAYEELARYPVSDSPIYAHPVVAGNRIFVRDRDSVGMWEIK